jgi:hypothetical protein
MPLKVGEFYENRHRVAVAFPECSRGEGEGLRQEAFARGVTPGIFSERGWGFNKFSLGQRAERTGIWGL